MAKQSVPQPLHIFGDVLGRLPPPYRRQLDARRPLTTDSLEVKKRCYAQTDEFLEKERAKAFKLPLASQCLLHCGLCPVRFQDPPLPPSQRPLTINVSGPTCLGWTPYGQQHGTGHPSMEPWLVWSKSMRAAAFDVCVMENSARMPPEMFQSVMAPTSHVFSLIVSPDNLGWPSRRKRLWSVAIDRTSCAWLDPYCRSLIGSVNLGAT